MGLIKIPDRRIRKPIGMPQIDWEDPLNRGLVGYWGMFPYEFGGKVVHDLSGNGNTGTLQGNTFWTPGNFGQCLKTAITDYVSIAANQALINLPATHNFTVIFWFCPDDAGTSRVAFNWSGTDDIYIYPNDTADGSGGTKIYWRDLGGNIISEAGPDLTGQWHQFAFVSRASNDHEAYRDAISVGTSSATGTAGPFSSVGIAHSTSGFPGKVDCYMFYNRALSPSEIALLYRRPF